MDFGVTIFAKLCRRTAFFALILAQLIRTPIATGNQTAANFDMAQAYTPMGGFDADRETQPALSPLILDQTTANAGVYLGVNDVVHRAETAFVSLEVQPDLSLGAVYNHKFTLSLGAERQDGGQLRVPDGWYQTDLIIVNQKSIKNVFSELAPQKNISSYDRFVTSVSRIDYVSGGRLTRTFSISLPNITTAAQRSHLYIQLTPLTKDCERNGVKVPCINTLPGKPRSADVQNSIAKPVAGIKPYLIEMPFVPLLPSGAGQGSLELAPGADDPDIVSNVGLYVSEAKTYKSIERWSRANNKLSPQEYALNSGLIYLRLSDVIKSNPYLGGFFNSLLAADGVGSLLFEKPRPEQANLLCLLPLQFRQVQSGLKRPLNAIELLRCAGDIDQFLSITRITHFDKLNTQKPPELLFRNPTTFNIMSNFMFSRSRSEDSTRTISRKPWEFLRKTLGVAIQPIETFGLNAIFDETYSVSESNTRTLSESALGSNALSLAFNATAFRMRVSRAVRCFDIRMNLASNKPGTTRGLYICADQVPELNVKEIYVHTYSSFQDTSIAEAYSPDAQIANYSLRGDRNIAMFVKMVRSNLAPNEKSARFPFEAFTKADQFFAERPGVIPMAITQAVTFKADAPTTKQKLFGGYAEIFETDK